MSLQIPADKAALTIEDGAVVPDLTLDKFSNRIFGHLTKGWSGSDWTGDALTCKGSVPVSGPESELQGLELGFVQLARATSYQAFYAGRIRKEGSISLNYFIPPAMTSTILLDGTKTARDPWYRNPTFAPAAGGRRAADFGDHPGMVLFLKLSNRKRSSVSNYLFHVFMEREFWTILTARESSGTLHYLSYFQWQVRYEFKVHWINGEPTKRSNSSFYKQIKGKTVGRPPEGELQAMLNNPTGERANPIGRRAQVFTETGHEPNRNELENQFITVPENFWT